ncbi:unnamed protein product [Polarella glacialis]|uniref:3'(2'),5'-bisphosphate nucleotidase n=1 Tax=Polarella glacialis TaxID=89957 RepID=A0A813G9P4_POLGL|nr:unnamed protein product [Polarella glacialis]
MLQLPSRSWADRANSKRRALRASLCVTALAACTAVLTARAAGSFVAPRSWTLLRSSPHNIQGLAGNSRHPGRNTVARAAEAWGGEYATEANAAAAVVQRAMQLCLALASDMRVVEGGSLGKEMQEGDVTAGVSFIKPGDSTPVTAADFAIQGLVQAALRTQFPNDRFMGEEDAEDLRADSALCDLSLGLCAKFGGPSERETFLAAVDAGLEPDRGQQERVWVLDPIDGTKGFMTGKGYVIGLALLIDGEPVVGAMGVPNIASLGLASPPPPLMVAVKDHGLRWWLAEGDGPVDFAAPQPEWASHTYALPVKDAADLKAGVDYPPWLLSPQSGRAACTPFGAKAGSTELCCGSMIKYFAVVAGLASGYVQYEEKLKTWDHACGVICVAEAGGSAAATDASSGPVRFPGRFFEVKGGIVCTSPWTTPEVHQSLLAAAKTNSAASGE